MAKRIIWSLRAQEDRKSILAYWAKRNKSNAYSIKLDTLFREALILIKNNPQIGKPTTIEQARVKTVRNYLLIYEEFEDAILLLTIWDSNRNPEKIMSFEE